MKKSDIKKEIQRLNNILENYKTSDEDKIFIKSLINNLKKYLDLIATKKEIREAN